MRSSSIETPQPGAPHKPATPSPCLQRTGPPRRGVSSQSRQRAELASAYDEHAAVLTRFASSLLGSQGDAEDLVHDVFIEAWERWDDYDPRRGSLRSWLRLRVRSRAIDRLRTQSRRRSTPLGETDKRSDEDPFRAVQGDRAWRLLRNAPERLRQVVELRFGRDLSVAEVAAQIGIPAGTVKSRQSHAVQFLRASVGNSIA